MSTSIAPLSLLASMLLGAGALHAQGGGITYAPGTHRYYVTSTVTYQQEMGGRKAQQVDIATEQQVTVTLLPHVGDTLVYAIQLDSIDVSAKPAIPIPDVTPYQGLMVKGSMSRSGRVYTLMSSVDTTGNPAVQQFIEGLRHFLVGFPPNAKVGTSWADTIATTASPSGQTVDSRTITTSHIAGDTTYNNEKAVLVARDIVTTIKGAVSQAGQQLPVDGNGTGTASYFVSHGGVYLGSSVSQKMTITSTMPDGSTYPIVQTAVSKTELMP